MKQNNTQQTKNIDASKCCGVCKAHGDIFKQILHTTLQHFREGEKKSIGINVPLV